MGKKKLEKVKRDWVGTGNCNFNKVLSVVLFEEVTFKLGLEGREEIGQAAISGAFQPQERAPAEA